MPSKNTPDELKANRARAAAKIAALGTQQEYPTETLDPDQTGEEAAVRARKMAEARQGQWIESQIASMKSAVPLSPDSESDYLDLDAARKRAFKKFANLGTPAARKPADA